MVNFSTHEPHAGKVRVGAAVGAAKAMTPPTHPRRRTVASPPRACHRRSIVCYILKRHTRKSATRDPSPPLRQPCAPRIGGAGRRTASK